MPRAEFLSRDESKQRKPLTLKDAQAIANELVHVAKVNMRPMALFIGADGDYMMTPRYSNRYPKWIEKWPLSFCGVYTPEVSPSDVVDDIMGMDA